MIHTSQGTDELGQDIALPLKDDTTGAVTACTHTFADLDPRCSQDVDGDSDLVLAGDASRP